MIEAGTNENNQLRQRSGAVDTDSDLVAFFYELMRDHLPPGTVEEIARNCNGFDEGNWQLTNGWLAEYAKDVVKRLTLSARERELIVFVESILIISRPRPDDIPEESKQKWSDAITLLKCLREP